MTEREIAAQASQWAIRTDDPAFEDWPALEAWLAADPRHAVAFDRVSIMVDEAAVLLRDAARPAPSGMTGRRLLIRLPRRTIPVAIGGALAASLAAALWMGLPLGPRPAESAQLVTTRAGEIRRVDLGRDGTVVLNGDSELRRDPGSPSRMTLVRGQASFDIVHDPARAFTVQVDKVEIIDIGTRFDVKRSDAAIRVAVAEGMVRLKLGVRAVTLAAGQESRVTRDGVVAAPSPALPQTIDGWRTGQLNYVDAPLAEVAADITRRSGVRLTLAPGLAGRRFAGSINVADGGEPVISRVEAILNVRARRVADGWILEPRAEGR
jgi:transmembrane sensor